MEQNINLLCVDTINYGEIKELQLDGVKIWGAPIEHIFEIDEPITIPISSISTTEAWISGAISGDLPMRTDSRTAPSIYVTIGEETKLCGVDTKVTFNTDDGKYYITLSGMTLSDNSLTLKVMYYKSNTASGATATISSVSFTYPYVKID